VAGPYARTHAALIVIPLEGDDSLLVGAASHGATCSQTSIGSAYWHWVVPRKTGPIGRSVRLVLLVAVAATLVSIVDASGSARFRNPHILTEPSAWLLHVLMLVVFVALTGTLAPALAPTHVAWRVQLVALLALVVVVAAAATVGQLAYAAWWGFPLADLVWCFDVLMLLLELATTAVAIILGTPGCELSVLLKLLPHAPARVASSRCVIGLHALDAWEARLSR
jgi:hypothetical protein